ncbi:hypothetical protein [Campylobacter upsaliensis]|nr:hypothetical protein [Campylobacter upsaliensis]MCR2101394.1 hypothetical protein [Campylobacter upsaliensis]
MQEIKCTTKAIAKTFITELECEFPLFAFKSPLTSTNKKGKVTKAKAQEEPKKELRSRDILGGV